MAKQKGQAGFHKGLAQAIKKSQAHSQQQPQFSPKEVNDIINAGAQSGIRTFVKEHPMFQNVGQALGRYLESKYLAESFDETYNAARQKGVAPGQLVPYLIHGISERIASGDVFNDRTKEILLNQSLESRASQPIQKFSLRHPNLLARIARHKAQKSAETERHIDKAIGTWEEIYNLAKEGKYDLPKDLKEPIEYLNRLGFAVPALRILKYDNLIKEREYSEILKNIKEGYRTSQAQAVSGLERYAMYQKVAALIFGFAGLVILVLNSGITGAVIGASGKVAGGLAGIFFLVLSCVMFLLSPKRKASGKKLSVKPKSRRKRR